MAVQKDDKKSWLANEDNIGRIRRFEEEGKKWNYPHQPPSGRKESAFDWIKMIRSVIKLFKWRRSNGRSKD